MERPRDVAGGLVVMAIGAGFFLFGRELELGTSFRMGPGYFPTVLSLLMIGLGAAMTVLAWRAPHQEGAFGHVPWRGVLLVAGATIFFGFALRGLGLAPVLVLVVLATAWASRYASWRSSVPLALGLAAFCVFLFVRGLGLPSRWSGLGSTRSAGQPSPPHRRRPASRRPPGWSCLTIWHWVSPRR
jgi:hypothetical protein